MLFLTPAQFWTALNAIKQMVDNDQPDDPNRRACVALYREMVAKWNAYMEFKRNKLDEWTKGTANLENLNDPPGSDPEN